MKYLIILFTILVLLPTSAHADSWKTMEWRAMQLECVKQVKEKLNYPTYKAVRYCNGGQMK